MDELPPTHVRKRQVIHIGGFDYVDTDRLNHRMAGGLTKFAQLWGIVAQSSAPELSDDGRVMNWDIEAGGPNWSTATRYTVLRWDDLIANYMEVPWWRKIPKGFSALLHFTLNGTIWRYFRATPRYGMFVLYPFFLLVGFAIFSIFVARTIVNLDFQASAFVGIVVGLGLFVGLLRWAGTFFHLYFALADWSFAADLVSGDVSGLDECLDQFSDEILARARVAGCDEVIFSGVSLGAVMMAEALSRAFARDPELGRHGPDLVFLTIGSSILKIGLHPGAKTLKTAIERVSREPALSWIEYQSKVDPINFFGTNPVTWMGLPETGKPMVKTMRIRETMTPEEYRYLRTNFLRLHRQFAMPNSRRYFYDFFMICFGPMTLAKRAVLGEKAVAAIGEDGGYREIVPTARSQRPGMVTQ